MRIGICVTVWNCSLRIILLTGNVSQVILQGNLKASRQILPVFWYIIVVKKHLSQNKTYRNAHRPLYDILAAPACVLLHFHLTFTKHLWQLGEKPLVPLDRALKLSEKE